MDFGGAGGKQQVQRTSRRPWRTKREGGGPTRARRMGGEGREGLCVSGNRGTSQRRRVVNRTTHLHRRARAVRACNRRQTPRGGTLCSSKCHRGNLSRSSGRRSPRVNGYRNRQSTRSNSRDLGCQGLKPTVFSPCRVLMCCRPTLQPSNRPRQVVEALHDSCQSRCYCGGRGTRCQGGRAWVTISHLYQKRSSA